MATDANAKKIRLELVSPEKLLLAEDVTMVVMPGTEGQFGVLADHIVFVGEHLFPIDRG